MSNIRIPTPLRSYTDGEKEIQVSGETVGEVMQQLTRQYPSVRPHLFGDGEQLRPYVNIFLNDEDIRNLDGDQTPVREGDRLMIIPSIAGGSRF
ncbi:MAG: MoaD family protein [Anaerolineales bacterium]|jgi:adenylyltransferase/sulfurtransferase